jgi:hypothetical protein
MPSLKTFVLLFAIAVAGSLMTPRVASAQTCWLCRGGCWDNGITGGPGALTCQDDAGGCLMTGQCYQTRRLVFRDVRLDGTLRSNSTLTVMPVALMRSRSHANAGVANTEFVRTCGDVILTRTYSLREREHIRERTRVIEL